MKKLKKKHFELFKKECRKWLDTYGLNDWEIHFTFEPDKECRATCAHDAELRMATINLSRYWRNAFATKDGIKQVAMHEVGHVLLSGLRFIATSRYSVKYGDVDTAIHSVIYRLENAFYEKS